MTNEELVIKAHQGDIDARNELILQNKRFLWKVAKHLYNEHNKDDWNRPDIDVEDLVQEGIFGLIQAIDDYNPSCGAKFTTYAFYKIKAKMFRLLDYRKENELSFISMQQPIGGEEDDLTLENIIADEHNYFEIIENRIDGSYLWEQVKGALSEIQYKIIIYYCFGFTFKQIAKKLNINENQVKNELQKAGQTLRSCKVRRLFKIFMDEYLDEAVSYLTAYDYSKPRSSGAKENSPVEAVVLRREEAIERIAGRY